MPTCCTSPGGHQLADRIRHRGHDARRVAGGGGGGWRFQNRSGTRALFIFRGGGLCNCVEDGVTTGGGEKNRRSKKLGLLDLLLARRQTLQFFDL